MKIAERDLELIFLVANRTKDLAYEFGVEYPYEIIVLDLVCVNDSTPLDLEALAVANEADFIHDVFGIRAHLDRPARKLEGCFMPRYAKIEQEH